VQGCGYLCLQGRGALAQPALYREGSTPDWFSSLTPQPPDLPEYEKVLAEIGRSQPADQRLSGARFNLKLSEEEQYCAKNFACRGQF